MPAKAYMVLSVSAIEYGSFVQLLDLVDVDRIAELVAAVGPLAVLRAFNVC